MSETVHPRELHQGRSKVARNKWQIRGTMGEFMVLSKYDLRVDRATYQRDATNNRALEFARNWSWVACGALSIALREVNNKLEFWVIDGQHRLEAALLRDDIDQLPCLCFEVDNIEEEATGFYEINLHRGALHTTDKFRAMLVKKDPVAVAVNELVRSTGRTIGKYSAANTINCVGVLMRCYEMDSARLERLFPVMVEILHGQPFHRDLVAALFWLEGALPADESLTRPRWTARLKQVGYDELHRSMAETCAYLNARTPKSAGIGVAKAINKGLRQKLIAKDVTDSEGNPLT